nr:hypothetical protein [uncultured Chryseobacterium sp.]
MQKKLLPIVLIVSLISVKLNGQVGIHTSNPQGSFTIDAAKDNPATGTPTAAQQANDVTVTPTGSLGVGTNTPAGKLHIDGGESRFSTSTSQWALSPSTGGTTGASNSLEIMDRVNNIRRMVFNDNGDVSLGGNVASNSAQGVVSIRTGNVGIGTGAPTNLLDVNGTTRIRTVNQAIGSTVIAPLYADPTGVVVKGSPSSTYGSLTFSQVNLASGASGALITGVVQGVYKAVVIVSDGCVNTSTAEFIIHNFSFNSYYGLNGQIGFVTNGTPPARPNFTQTVRTSVAVDWPGISGCQDGGNSTALNYTLAMPSAGTINVTNNGNVNRTYRITLTKID